LLLGKQQHAAPVVVADGNDVASTVEHAELVASERICIRTRSGHEQLLPDGLSRRCKTLDRARRKSEPAVAIIGRPNTISWLVPR
jgi:hypothetical protein